MSCCGSSRDKSKKFPAASETRTTVLLEYTGKTGLNIVGPGSRIAYRFERPGARALVDRRDLAYLASVPVLRQVR
jgi:hypothetical protein